MSSDRETETEVDMSNLSVQWHCTCRDCTYRDCTCAVSTECVDKSRQSVQWHCACQSGRETLTCRDCTCRDRVSLCHCVRVADRVSRQTAQSSTCAVAQYPEVAASYRMLQHVAACCSVLHQVLPTEFDMCSGTVPRRQTEYCWTVYTLLLDSTLSNSRVYCPTVL